MQKLIIITTLVIILGSVLASCGSTKPCPAYGKANTNKNHNKSI